MKAQQITYQIAMAAGQDAGNRSMRKAGRSKWNDQDKSEAVKTFNKLIPQDKEASK